MRYKLPQAPGTLGTNMGASSSPWAPGGMPSNLEDAPMAGFGHDAGVPQYPGSVLVSVVAQSLHIADRVANSFAEAISGDLDTVTTDDVISIRETDLNDAINEMLMSNDVDTRQATALEKGATARLVKYIADQLYLIC